MWFNYYLWYNIDILVKIFPYKKLDQGSKFSFRLFAIVLKTCFFDKTKSYKEIFIIQVSSSRSKSVWVLGRKKSFYL